MKERLLNEARRIGDRLLEDAKTDDKGMYWETMTMDMDRNISYKTAESIYSGVAGIALFFLELYKQTQNPRYLDAAVQGMKWAVNYCENNSSPYYAFFTGRMGIPYVLLRMYDVTGDRGYIEQALTIARTVTEFLKSSQYVDDLINGTSGAVLGLLHLHAAVGEEWILEAVDAFIKRLVNSAHHGPRGLYWDRSQNTINGLCGFSHGAAGIGFVFLELGHYFQNETFYILAEQAFLYERYFYDESRGNWPDLRKGIYNDEDRENHRKAFLEGNREFFTVGGDMNAWCHGAAGLGLSRLRAHRLLKKEIYEKEALAAIRKTVMTTVETDIPEPTFTLCHGGGGNADLFIYAYQIFEDDQYLRLAEKVAQKAMNFYEKNNYYISGFHYGGDKQDRSLFMGNAGIGYFYLRVLDPLHVPCIQAPVLETACGADKTRLLSQYPFITISPVEVQKQLLHKDFYRTLVIAEKLVPQKLAAFFNGLPYGVENPGTSATSMESFIGFMEPAIDEPSLSSQHKELLSEIFGLELEKRRLDESLKSHSLLNIKEIVLREKGEEIIKNAADEQAFKESMFKLEPDSRVALMDWNWNLGDREEWKEKINKDVDVDPEEDGWAVLLRPAPQGIIETEMSPFTYTILAEFREANRVDRVIEATVDAFEALTPEQEKMLREKIVEQIKYLLAAGILIESMD